MSGWRHTLFPPLRPLSFRPRRCWLWSGLGDLHLEANDMSVRLEKGINLHDLVENKEVELIVSEEQNQNNRDEEDELDYKYFEPEDVFQNVYHGDEDDSPADENEDIPPFERLAHKMIDLTKDGGVTKKVLRPGAGPVVVPGALVRVHFNGYLEYADEPFDSSRLRKEVKKFRLNEGEVLVGFDIAVASMKKGELSRFLLRPEYAFGKMGCPPRIPADSILMYEIELLSFVEKEGVDDYYSMTEQERRNLDLPSLMKVCKSEKQEGNEYYNNKNYRRAVGKYRMAVRILEDAHLKNAEEEKEQKKALLKLYLNLALCCEKIGEARHAVINCSRAYRIDRNDVKVLYHYGKSLRLNGEFDRAKQYLKQAQHLSPHNKDINNELKQLNQAVSNFRQVEKETCMRMFAKSAGSEKLDDAQKAGEKQEKDKTDNTGDEDDDEQLEECSPEFKRSVYENLRKFKEDNCADELPLTSSKLSPPEIYCILQVAQELDLDPVTRGTGESSHLLVKKKKS